MENERKVIIFLLNLINCKHISTKLLSKEANLPLHKARDYLKKLKTLGIIYYDNDGAEFKLVNRIKLSVYAVKMGIDFETISSILNWQEFENFGAEIFKKNNYYVKKDVRFSFRLRRYQIDLIASQDCTLFSVDCKHWKKKFTARILHKIVRDQINRTQTFVKSESKFIKEFQNRSLNNLEVIPIILSLSITSVKYVNSVPIIPVFQLNSFLNNMQGFTHIFKRIKVSTENT